MKGIVIFAAIAVCGSAYLFSGNPAIERKISKPPSEVYAELSRFADGFKDMKTEGVCVDRACDRTESRSVAVEKVDGKSITMKWMQGTQEVASGTAIVSEGAEPGRTILRISTNGGLAAINGSNATLEPIVDRAIEYIERGQHIPTGAAAIQTVQRAGKPA